jgi:hypothetical protein
MAVLLPFLYLSQFLHVNLGERDRQKKKGVVKLHILSYLISVPRPDGFGDNFHIMFVNPYYSLSINLIYVFSALDNQLQF